MGVQGSVLATLATAGKNTITMPRSGLTVVGIYTAGDLQIPIDASRYAVFPGQYVTRPASIMWKVNFVLQGNQLNVITGSANQNVVIYYGSSFPGAKKLEDYAGVIASASPGASGNTTTTVSFPGGQRKLTGFVLACSAGYIEANWSTESGQQFTGIALNGQESVIEGVDNMSIADSVSVLFTYSAAMTYAMYFFYK